MTRFLLLPIILSIALFVACSGGDRASDNLSFVDQVDWESHQGGKQEENLDKVVFLADLPDTTFETGADTVTVRLEVSALLRAVEAVDPDGKLPSFWRGFYRILAGDNIDYNVSGRTIRGLSVTGELQKDPATGRNFLMVSTISDDSSSRNITGLAVPISEMTNRQLDVTVECMSEQCEEARIAGGHFAVVLTKPANISGLSYEQSAKSYSGDKFSL
jgi:hypothetical protein